MTQVDETTSIRYMQLDFVEFLEAFARILDYEFIRDGLPEYSTESLSSKIENELIRIIRYTRKF